MTTSASGGGATRADVQTSGGTTLPQRHRIAKHNSITSPFVQQWRDGAAAGRFACEVVFALPPITVSLHTSPPVVALARTSDQRVTLDASDL